MNPLIREAIVGGDASITLNIKASDLREIMREMAYEERKRIMEETERSREQYKIPREEAAKMLHTTPSNLWKWEKSGYLIPQRHGRKVYYRQSDIDGINESKTNKSANRQ